MRIMYCIPTLESGGAERQLTYLAAALAGAGHDVHVAFLREGPNLERLRAGGVASHRLPGAGNHDPRIFLELLKLMRRIRPDLVQTSLPQMDVLGGEAALVARTPWVLRESSCGPAFPASWKSRLRAALARRAAAIVSNSRAGDAYWRSKAAARPRHVIPNGVPLDEALKARPAAGAVDVPFEPAEKLVLFAGRMNRDKNVENLLVALARVAHEVPFRVLLCGDGPLRPALEELARKLGLGPRAVFTGNVPGLLPLMKRADAFAFLSRFEGCPNVVLEAMACGCPLVVSDIAAHREILDERSACFVNPEEPPEIAEAVKATLTSGAAAAHARTRAASARAAEWSVEVMARRYEQLYLSVSGKA